MNRIFVTGASGFIAKHIVKTLLASGYSVRASVRSAHRQAELEALFPSADIDYVFLDLTDDAGWETAMTGCDALIHTASPFPLTEPKDRNDLINPAVEGTLRALKAAQNAGITRVVLTSSNAAIYKDSTKAKTAASTESNWTDPDAPFVSAYEASKTLAEKAAWDFVEDTPIKLTTINPALVLGAPLDQHYGTSLDIVKRLMKGTDPLIPPADIGVVDVVDVATLHVKALILDSTIGNRYSANAGMLSFKDMTTILKKWDPSLPVTTRVAPAWLIKALSLFMPDLRIIAKSLGYNLSVPSHKAEHDFDMELKSAKDSLIDSAKSLQGFSNE